MINNIHEHKENSKAIAVESLRNEMYGEGDRKYVYVVDDTIKAVEEVTMITLQKQQEAMLAQQWTCTMVGNEKMVKAFSQMISACKKGIVVQEVNSMHELKAIKNKVLLTNIPSKQNIDFSIGAPIPFTLHHPDYVPLNFALAVLGKWSGFAGRLMRCWRAM